MSSASRLFLAWWKTDWCCQQSCRWPLSTQGKQEAEIEERYDTIGSAIGIGIVFALGFTAITCGSVLIFYTSIVSSRFEVVRKNAARLTLIGGPKPELQGDDELAYLDKNILRCWPGIAKGCWR